MSDGLESLYDSRWNDFLADKVDLAKARKDWIDHLSACIQCDRDMECFACVLQGETKLMIHSCNCKVGEGYGYLLGVTYQRELSKVLQDFRDMMKREKVKE